MPQDEPFTKGLYFAESQAATTFRWSGPIGQVLFTGAGRRPWKLRLRASGLHPDGPASVSVSINGQLIATEAWGGTWPSTNTPSPAARLGCGATSVLPLPPNRSSRHEISANWDSNSTGQSYVRRLGAHDAAWIILAGCWPPLFFAIGRHTGYPFLRLGTDGRIIAGRCRRSGVIWARRWQATCTCPG